MVWKLKPSEHVQSVQDANLTAQMDQTPLDTSAPIAEDAPVTLLPQTVCGEPGCTRADHMGANDRVYLPEPSAEAKALEAAIRSGDRYRVASALASMGVRTDDELLSHILLPPFGDEPAKSNITLDANNTLTGHPS